MTETTEPRSGGIATILLPTDGSEISKVSARYAGDLARVMGARIIVVHVAETPFDYKAYGLGVETIKRIQEDLMTEIDAKLKSAIEACGEGVEFERRILEGEAFEEIVRAATDDSADLIVLATHGYQGVKHWLLGSTAERVVRLATCPVLTLRESHSYGV